MGFLDSLVTWLGLKNKEARVLCVGLDNSGKTTLINQLKPEASRSKNVVPTIGFSNEVFTHAKISFHVYDMSGQGRYRNLWEHYYGDVHAIIFVLDSSDKLRIPIAKDELDQLLQHPDTIKVGLAYRPMTKTNLSWQDMKKKSVPILLLANKMDLRDSLTAERCAMFLKLDELTDRSYHICSTNALTGEGLEEAIDWLTENVRKQLLQTK